MFRYVEYLCNFSRLSDNLLIWQDIRRFVSLLSPQGMATHHSLALWGKIGLRAPGGLAGLAPHDVQNDLVHVGQALA